MTRIQDHEIISVAKPPVKQNTIVIFSGKTPVHFYKGLSIFQVTVENNHTNISMTL